MKLKEYKSLEEKKKWFKEHSILNSQQQVKEFLSSIEDENSSSKVFRGVGEAKYRIYSSSQRMWITQELENRFDSYLNFLEKLVGEFKSTNKVIEKFFSKIETLPEEIPILSYLQHYGAPTPLIDFTKNMNVALFFAIDGLRHNPSLDIDNYFSIYTLDDIEYSIQKKKSDYYDEMRDTIEKSPIGKYEKVIDTQKELDKLFNKELLSLENFMKYKPEFISETTIKNITYYTETNLNILNQSGLFVINPLAITPLEEAFLICERLMATKKDEEILSRDKREVNLLNITDKMPDEVKFPVVNHLTCIDIHKSFKHQILDYLNIKGINSQFIYPDVKEMISETVKNILK